MNREEILKSIEGLANTGLCCVLNSHGEDQLSYGEYDVLFRSLQCVAGYARDMLKEKDAKLSSIHWAYVRNGVEEFNKELETGKSRYSD